MEEVTVSVGGQILSLPADAILSNSSMVFTGNNAMDNQSTYVTVPWTVFRDGTILNTVPTSQGLLLKNFQESNGSTFLMDTSQFPLLTDAHTTHLVLGAAEEGFVDDLADDNPLQDVSDAEALGTVLADDAGGLSPMAVGGIMEPLEEEEEEEEEASAPIVPKKRPGRPRKSEADEVQPPIGKGPFQCDMCGKEFQRWSHLTRHKKTHVDDKPHRCLECGVTFNVQTNLVLHMATHNADNLECPECHKKFARAASLKSHLHLHEREENVFCTECGDEFYTQAQLTRHLKVHQEEWLNVPRTYKCRHCDQQFGKLWRLRRHMRDHNKMKFTMVHRTHRKNVDRTGFGHKCHTCDKGFQKPSQLERHLRIHTGERPFTCPTCNKAFNQKGALQIHMNKHTGSRPHRCLFCAAAFSQRGNLRAHIQRVHTMPASGENVYKCEECPCVFRKLGSLNAHMSRMHSGDVPKILVVDEEATSEKDMNATMKQLLKLCEDMDCVNVNKRPSPLKSNPVIVREEKQGLTNSDILQQALQNSGLSDKKGEKGKDNQAAQSKGNKKDGHVMIVTLADKSLDGTVRKHVIKLRKAGGIRWHQCTHCTKEFKKPSDLVRHLRIHTHERPFKCHLCFRGFAVKSTLTAHIRTHSGLKKFTCPHCQKKFSSQSSLKVHVRLHTGLKPYNCPNCGKTFRTAGHRKMHVLSHNRDARDAERRLRHKLANRSCRAEELSMLPDIPLQEPIYITNSGFIQQTPRTKTLLVGSQIGPDRPYKCCCCSSAFKKSSHLKQHLRSHTGEKPYKCLQCNRSFVSSGVLKAHTRTHEGIKSFKCSLCGRLFTTNGSLKRHMATHSEDRPFMCPYCQKTFKTSVNCRKHMKTHKLEIAHQVAEAAAKNSELASAQVFNDTTSVLAPGFSQDFDDEAFEIATQGQEQGAEGFTQAALVQTLAAAADLTRTEELPDSAESIALPTLTGQEALSQIEQTLNQQMFASDTLNQQSQGTLAISGDSDAQLLAPGAAGSVLDSEMSSCLVVGQTTSVIQSSSRQGRSVGTLPLLGASSSISSSKEGKSGEDGMSLSGAQNARERDDLNEPEQGPDGSSVFSQAFETQNFDSSVFSAINLQGDQLDLASSVQGGVMTATSMSSILQQPDSSSLEDHLDDSEDDALDLELKCRVCSKTFKQSSQLEQHMQIHRGEKPFQCSQCQRRFVSLGVLQSHIKMHCGIKEFKCEICNATFSTKSTRTRHMATHTSNSNAYKCDVCSAIFHNQASLKKHKESHSVTSTLFEDGKVTNITITQVPVPEGSPIPAENSENSTGDQNVFLKKSRRKPAIIQLSAKQTEELAKQPVERANSVSEKVLIASAAEKDRVSEIKDRLQELEKAPRFSNQCTQCPKSFKKPSDLVRHIRIHTGERPYGCHICGKSFTVKSTLDSHHKTHTGAKQYACHVCENLFATKGSLKVHMRLHTGAKPFKCPHCDIRFRTSGHRKAHIASHFKSSVPRLSSASTKKPRLPLPTRRTTGGKTAPCPPTELSIPTQEDIETSSHVMNHSEESAQEIATVDSNIRDATIENMNVVLTQPDGFTTPLFNAEGTRVIGAIQLQLTPEGNITQNVQITGMEQMLLNHNQGQAVQMVDDAFLQQLVLQTENGGGETERGENGGEEVEGRREEMRLFPEGLGEEEEEDEDEEEEEEDNSDMDLSSLEAANPILGSAVSRATGNIGNVRFDVQTNEHGQIVNIQQSTMDLLQDQNVTVSPSVVPTIILNTSSSSSTQVLPTLSESAGINLLLAPPPPPTASRTNSSQRGGNRVCEYCEKSFSKPSQLQRHLRIHTGERPFQCTVCDKRFNQKNALQIHMKKHTGEKPYVCAHCHFCFTQRGNLRTHLRRAHPNLSQDVVAVALRKDLVENMSVGAAELMDEMKGNMDLDGVMGELFPQVAAPSADS